MWTFYYIIIIQITWHIWDLWSKIKIYMSVELVDFSPSPNQVSRAGFYHSWSFPRWVQWRAEEEAGELNYKLVEPFWQWEEASMGHRKWRIVGSKHGGLAGDQELKWECWYNNWISGKWEVKSISQVTVNRTVGEVARVEGDIETKDILNEANKD